MVEHVFDAGLRVVEGALDGERVDVRFGGRRHHAALDVGDAAVRKQNEHVGSLRCPEGLDRGPARVTRCCSDDRRGLAACGQHMIHHASEQLHGDVLKRQSRSVKQFQHEPVRPDLHQRRHGGMAEARIGRMRHAGEIST